MGVGPHASRRGWGPAGNKKKQTEPREPELGAGRWLTRDAPQNLNRTLAVTDRIGLTDST